MRALFAIVISAVVFFQLGTHLGELKGQARALDTKNPSDELEMACLGLWVGEQNKKYWEAQRGK